MIQKQLLSSVIQNPDVSLIQSDSLKMSIGIQSFPIVNQYLVKDAYISPFGPIFNRYGTLQKESLYWHVKSSPYPSFIKKIVLGRVQKIHTPCVVFHHPWYDNFYHFLLECVPRLFLLKHLAPSHTLLLPPDLKKFHYEILSLFGFSTLFTMDETLLYKVDEVVFCNHISNEWATHRFDVLIPLAAFLKGKIEPKTFIHPKYPFIYLSRKRVSKRKCLNEQELLTVLKPFGFQELALDDYTFVEQIQIMSQAKYVIGVHGSAFVHLMFMQAGAVVHDLIEEHHNDWCYAHLCTPFKVKYVFDACVGIGPKDDFRNNDIRVDVEKMFRLAMLHGLVVNINSTKI